LVPLILQKPSRLLILSLDEPTGPWYSTNRFVGNKYVGNNYVGEGRAKMKLAGGYAIGDRFWDRKDDLRLFMDKVSEGNHLLLVA